MARRIVAIGGAVLALLLFTMGTVQADRLGGAYRGPFEDDVQQKEETTQEVTPESPSGEAAPTKETGGTDDSGGMGTDDGSGSGGDDDTTSPPPSGDDDGAGMEGGDTGTEKQAPTGDSSGAGNTGGLGGSKIGVGPGGGKTRQREVLAFWPFWFEHNKEWLLADHLKRRAAGASIPVVSSCFYFTAPGNSRVITPINEDVKLRKIFPMLVEASTDRESPWIRDAAVFALGKLGAAEGVPTLVDRVYKDTDAQVREDALLALGLTRQKAAFEPLMKALGDPRYKSYAALGLALLGHKEAVGPLLKEYKALVRVRDQKTASCLAVAIGALADESHVDELADPIRKPGNDKLKVFICQALGRIPGDASEVWLMRALASKDDEVKAAAILSLAEFPDKQVFSRLTGVKTSNRMAKVFTQVALARFALDLDDKDKMRRHIASTLNDAAEKPGKDEYVAMYATLGLAMMTDPIATGFFLESLHGDSKKFSLENRSAMVLALGFLGSPEAAVILRHKLKTSVGEPELQGYAALALGLMGDMGSKEAIRDELSDTRGKAQLQRPACWALGLLGDRDDVNVLISVLKREGPGRHSVRGAAAIGIGLIGDASAVDKLLKIAKRDRNTSNRAFAIAALGCLIDKDPVPRLPQLFKNTHYRKIKEMEVLHESLKSL
jgi:HEAT repeat protein